MFSPKTLEKQCRRAQVFACNCSAPDLNEKKTSTCGVVYRPQLDEFCLSLHSNLRSAFTFRDGRKPTKSLNAPVVPARARPGSGLSPPPPPRHVPANLLQALANKRENYEA